MHFFLALFWLVLGMGVLVWHARTGDPRGRLPFREYPISYGWFMLVLSLYNLVRWRRDRLWKLRQREVREQERIALAARRPGRHRTEVQEPPNPDFNFTDEPPK
jgi:transposase